MCKKGATVTLADAAVAGHLYKARTPALGHPSNVVWLKAAGGCHSYPCFIEQHV
jgi:hypothetical protein